MPDTIDIDRLEADVYRSRFEDGSVDIFVGVSLVWIGVAWLFLPSIAGIASVFPAILVAPFVAWRTKFLDQRLGHVRFGEQRRRWERRTLLLALIAGLMVLLLGVVVYFVVRGSEADLLSTIAPGLIAFLLGAGAIGVTLVTGAWRLLVVGAVLVAGGVFAISTDANPGAALIPAGLVAAIWGTAMLIRFVDRHPIVEPQQRV